MLTKGNLIKLFTFIVCLAIAQASIGKDLYMSPTGSDTNNGSASSPVYTITKAQALAEESEFNNIESTDNINYSNESALGGKHSNRIELGFMYRIKCY